MPSGCPHKQREYNRNWRLRQKEAEKANPAMADARRARKAELARARYVRVNGLPEESTQDARDAARQKAATDRMLAKAAAMAKAKVNRYGYAGQMKVRGI
jgi:hypothetical protein